MREMVELKRIIGFNDLSPLLNLPRRFFYLDETE